MIRAVARFLVVLGTACVDVPLPGKYGHAILNAHTPLIMSLFVPQGMLLVFSQQRELYVL